MSCTESKRVYRQTHTHTHTPSTTTLTAYAHRGLIKLPKLYIQTKINSLHCAWHWAFCVQGRHTLQVWTLFKERLILEKRIDQISINRVSAQASQAWKQFLSPSNCTHTNIAHFFLCKMMFKPWETQCMRWETMFAALSNACGWGSGWWTCESKCHVKTNHSHIVYQLARSSRLAPAIMHSPSSILHDRCEWLHACLSSHKNTFTSHECGHIYMWRVHGNVMKWLAFAYRSEGANSDNFGVCIIYLMGGQRHSRVSLSTNFWWVSPNTPSPISHAAKYIHTRWLLQRSSGTPLDRFSL